MVRECKYDITVIGGGLSGICASIAAARCGARVALVHDRPLLGGNASGELRIHVAGADCSGNAIARYVRESGIIDEIRLENLQKNPANSHDVFSLIMRERVQAEPNIDLFMNTRARRIRMANQNTIEAVEADQLTTEREFSFHAGIFIDCTGDGSIGSRAGARFRMGREAGDEFDESLAPLNADDKTFPSCVEFYLKDMGVPVDFKPPPWAFHYESQDDLPHRDLGPESWQFAGLNGGFWWLSAGGDVSTIDDNEETYRLLLKVLMGIWDLMKNRGDFGAQNYALDWISPIPGKRESRRFEGQHWLTQNDVMGGTLFDDRVAFGGWPIDIHPPEGVSSKEPPYLSVPLKRPYSIPLRCLYSKNISNLMFAGRDASFTHIGLGSSRVMATCAVAGQAAGAAAAVAVARNSTPHEIQQKHVREVQQVLLAQGVFIPRCALHDSEDLARSACLSASSEAKLAVAEDEAGPGLRESSSFEHELFQLFPLSEGRLDSVDILVSSDRQVQLKGYLRKAEDIWDFSRTGKRVEVLTKETTATSGGGREWIRFAFGLNRVETGFYWMSVEAADNGDKVRWLGTLNSPVGAVRGRLEAVACPREDLAPGYQTMRGAFIFRLSPESRPYPVQNVITGTSRPECWTNLWVSEQLEGEPEWLELAWERKVQIGQVDIAFDGQFDSNITWPPPLGVFGCKTLPAVVKSYDISARIKGSWESICEVEDNYRYRRTHSFEPVQADRLRITIRETNGADEARIFEVRVYPKPTLPVLQA